MTILVLNGSPRKSGRRRHRLHNSVSIQLFLLTEHRRIPCGKGNPEIIRIQDCAESSSCRNKNLINTRSKKLVEVLKEKYPKLKK